MFFREISSLQIDIPLLIRDLAGVGFSFAEKSEQNGTSEKESASSIDLDEKGPNEIVKTCKSLIDSLAQIMFDECKRKYDQIHSISYKSTKFDADFRARDAIYKIGQAISLIKNIPDMSDLQKQQLQQLREMERAAQNQQNGSIAANHHHHQQDEKWMLHNACKTGNLDEISKILDTVSSSNDFDIDCPDLNGATPLLLCLSNGNVAGAKLLVKKNANPKKIDNLMETYLHKACLAGWALEAVTFLIEQGVPVDAQVCDGDGGVMKS